MVAVTGSRLNDMNYGFFDYKYNIPDYHGQDFSSLPRFLYPVVSLLLIVLLMLRIRKHGWKHITSFLKILSVYLILEEVVKISWESYWDITTGRGFNAGGILPLDTCSIFLYALPLAAFGKGLLRRCSLAWICSIGVLSGFSYMLFPMALNWYPLFSYGAYHSLMYHFMMVFTGLAIVFSGLIRIQKEDILFGFFPQLLMSACVIPLDYLFNWDYMLLKSASGIPFIEDLARSFAKAGANYKTTVLVMLLYFSMDVFSMFLHHRVQNTFFSS